MDHRFKAAVIDRRALGDPLASRILERLGGVEIIETGYVTGHIEPGRLILRYHEGAFVKDFPVTPGAPPCGEKYLTALQGCLFGCSYCYLRSYLSHSAVTVLVNTPKMEQDIHEVLREGAVRLTTGELSDSLTLDRITGLTASILPLLEGTGAVLEARTKSSETGHLLDIDAGLAAKHLMVTWTLSPSNAIAGEEKGAASLDERLEGISKISKAGIRFSLRLDPIIPFYWDLDVYREMLTRVKEEAAGNPVRIEMGLLRFPPGLMDAVMKDSPYSRILRGEYVRDGEGKMRLYRPIRMGMYRELAKMIREILPGTAIELSQEDTAVWEDAGIEPY